MIFSILKRVVISAPDIAEIFRIFLVLFDWTIFLDYTTFRNYNNHCTNSRQFESTSLRTSALISVFTIMITISIK